MNPKAGHVVPETWLLLIYTVPAEPSRKRAFIWRELKKVGAVYLRDGVCALPQRDETLAAFVSIAAKVGELGGSATLAQNSELDAVSGDRVVSKARAAREDEYADVAREAERFLEHVRRETEHREFTYSELEELEADLEKLRRWAQQIRARDYVGVQKAGRVDELLNRCGEELATFLEATFMREAADE